MKQLSMSHRVECPDWPAAVSRVSPQLDRATASRPGVSTTQSHHSAPGWTVPAARPSRLWDARPVQPVDRLYGSSMLHLTRIVVVHDNMEIAAALAHLLRLESYEVRLAATDQSALKAAIEWPADLVIVDVARQSASGFDLLHALADRGCHVPVLVLSPGRKEPMRVDGRGAPFTSPGTSGSTLVAHVERVRMLLGRASAPNGNAAIHFGSVVVDPESHTVMRGGNACSLTPKAFALLVALARRHGAVVSRHELLREVWGYGPHVLTRTVDSHVAELRRKLEDDPAQPKHIVTVWAVGYRFVV
jgi:two-component system, OmpR family, alkaline phosphatase synthesis response regulator PhoP